MVVIIVKTHHRSVDSTMVESRKCPRCKGTGKIRKSMYHKGRRFEYKVRDYLTDRGWVVSRSYGSKGVIDLLAEKNGIWIGIQAKNRKTGSYLTPKEVSELQTFYDTFDKSNNVFSMSVWSDNKIKEMRITGPIKTVHAFTLPGSLRIHWRYLIERDNWWNAEDLIKTGKL